MSTSIGHSATFEVKPPYGWQATYDNQMGGWVYESAGVRETEPKVKTKRLKNASVADVARMLGVCEERLRQEQEGRNRAEAKADRLQVVLTDTTRERDELRRKLDGKDAYIVQLQTAQYDAQSVVDRIRVVLKRLGEDAVNVQGISSGAEALIRVLEARCLAAGE